MLQIPQEMIRSTQRFDSSGRPFSKELAHEIEVAGRGGSFKPVYMTLVERVLDATAVLRRFLLGTKGKSLLPRRL